MNFLFCTVVILAISSSIFAVPSTRERRDDIFQEISEAQKLKMASGGPIAAGIAGVPGSLDIADGRLGGNVVSLGSLVPNPPPPAPNSVNVQQTQLTKVNVNNAK